MSIFRDGAANAYFLQEYRVLTRVQHIGFLYFCRLVVVRSLSCVWLFVTPWTAAHQTSLSFTIFQSLLKLKSHELVRPSYHLILSCPLLLLPSSFPSIRVFFMSRLFTSGGQSIGASASVPPMNIQGWFPLGLTGLISLLSTGLSTVFSSTTVWKHQFFGNQPYLWSNIWSLRFFFTVSHLYMTMGKIIALTMCFIQPGILHDVLCI